MEVFTDEGLMLHIFLGRIRRLLVLKADQERFKEMQNILGEI